MRNSISNGNGDSRYMKSAIPENITHEELVALLREGTFPFDFNGINPAGFAQLGQGLTKENLLDDNSEMDIWGTIGDRTPNDAFSFIGKILTAHDEDIVKLAADLEGKIVAGTYTGNGATSARTISLDITPVAVIVAQEGFLNSKNLSGMAVTGNAAKYDGGTFVKIVENGFNLPAPSSSTYSGPNAKSKIYYYLAIC